ncbi:MAG TPA: aldehyde dehydrogenase (NADP(+)) [Pseudonocardiaceae bacterium]|jgi:NADP-dependent aldehyde dehydrogenase|nr:aldehyde dehydrogenase (NADP(+)) [Pseudonocardiaceae bacterium]
MTAVPSIDPRTGAIADAEVAEETTAARVDEICRAAAAAAPAFADAGRTFRAGLLRALADALEADRETVVGLADRETALGPGRLNGELTRTAYQLRVFAEVLDEGSYVEAIIDHAGDTPMGPRPDLRRMLIPVGPVAVFGASNFPLAFSVPGGDTASALAAGCPVVVKAHPSHPATSQRVFEVLARAARDFGAPEGVLGIVHGQEAGGVLVEHEAIKAVGFTGSLRGGRALAELAAARPEPIPFFGELSSLNPVVITKAAAAERAEQIATGLVGSFTLGAGQFCTKPGLVFVPAGPDGDRLREAAAAKVTELEPQFALNEGISRTYGTRTGELAGLGALDRVAEAKNGTEAGFAMRPTLFATSTERLTAEVAEECFGPTTLLVSYNGDDDLLAALALVPGSLTATVHVTEQDDTLSEKVLRGLQDKAGRLLFNGYPTGVAVSWAQHHGGPWPSTNTQHTSVGTTAIRRFLRPVAFQDAPAQLLPAELTEANTAGIPRRVDGVLVLPR